MNGDFTLIVSDEILNEFLEVIHRPKFSFLDETKIKRFVILLLEFCEVPDVKTRVKVIVEDPDDNMVLACAKESNDDVIVSGDSHLLKLGIWSMIRIIRSSELLEELR
jgi:putative PIN family toxin of toxin-antitoxin system